MFECPRRRPRGGTPLAANAVARFNAHVLARVYLWPVLSRMEHDAAAVVAMQVLLYTSHVCWRNMFNAHCRALV